MKEQVETIDNYRTQLTKIVKRDFPYLIMGLVVVISAGAFLYFQLSPVRGLNILELSSDKDILNKEVLDKTNVIAEIIEQKEINYISQAPQNETLPSSALSRPEENGQISAISSDQVTYTKETYIVEEGDSLASIAGIVYGDRNAWVRIAEANNLLDNPDALEAGMELVIPR
jgi:nucleoid-associated protein YgaU